MSGTTADLIAISGSGPSDLWAIGAGSTVLHSTDGASWTSTTIASGWLSGVWAASQKDAWIVGGTESLVSNSAPILLHWDGSSWAEAPGASALKQAYKFPQGVGSVWASSSNDIWLSTLSDADTGNYCRMLHWNGSSWSSSDVVAGQSPPSCPIWGTGPGRLWAGTGGGAYRWTGSAWDLVPGFPSNSGVTSVWGSSDTDVWFLAEVSSGQALFHWNGISLEQTRVDLSSQGSVSGWSGWSASSDEVFIVGNNGQVLHEASGIWKGMTTDWNDEIDAIYGAAGDDVWLAGFASYLPTLRHWDGVSLNTVLSPPPQTCDDAGSYSFTPSGIWSDNQLINPGVWICGNQCLAHWDRAHWSTYAVPGGPPDNSGWKSIWGIGPTDMWTVGAGPSAAHWDGTSWIPSTLPMSTSDSGYVASLNSVYGSASDDVWAVGIDGQGDGLVLHWNGATWTQLPSLPQQSLIRIVSRSRNEAYAVGDGSMGVTVWRWDGRAWSMIAAPTQDGSSYAIGLWISPSSQSRDIWVLSSQGLSVLGSPNWQTVTPAFGSPVVFFGTTSTSGNGYTLWVGGRDTLWTYTP
jgi:hypothetical protein